MCRTSVGWAESEELPITVTTVYALLYINACLFTLVQHAYREAIFGHGIPNSAIIPYVKPGYMNGQK